MRPFIYSLTSLRFLAAFGVLCFHQTMPNKFLCDHHLPGIIGNLFKTGFIGVNLFFVLSGFILTYTHTGEGAALNLSNRDFFAARFARIYPVYLLGVLVIAPLVLWGNIGRFGETGGFWWRRSLPRCCWCSRGARI